MTMHIRVGGNWVEADPRIRVGGSWREVSDIWVRRAGVWEKAYQRLALALTNQSIFAGGASSASAGIRIDSDGNVYQVVNGSSTQLAAATNWVRPNSEAGNYSARLVVLSGNSPGVGSAAVNTYLALTSDRLWQLSVNSSFEIEQASWRIDIAETGATGTVLASATFTMEVDTT